MSHQYKSRPQLPICRPTLPTLDAIGEDLSMALASGIVTNGGPFVSEFEARLTALMDVPSLVFCNGEQALITLLMAADVRDREVIMPSFTFAGSAHAVVVAGATPVFADIVSLDRPLLDPRDVERRITDRTAAILAVDSYGFASDYAALEALAKHYDLQLLIDSAPAFGSRSQGRLNGTRGSGQIFSFHATKPFSTLEGGCLCSHDESLLHRAAAIRNFGQDAQGEVNWVGLNGKMSELNAIIGLDQLDGLDARLQHRRRAARHLVTGLASIPGLRPCLPAEDEEPVWQYVPIHVDAQRYGLCRDELQQALQAAGIMARRYYAPACHQMPAYAGLNACGLDMTERLSAGVLALPVYNDMRDEECERILGQLRMLHLQRSRKAQQESTCRT